MIAPLPPEQIAELKALREKAEAPHADPIQSLRAVRELHYALVNAAPALLAPSGKLFEPKEGEK